MDYKHIKFDDVMRFFDAANAARLCPVCSSSEWTLQFSRLKDKPELVFATNALGLGAPFLDPMSPNYSAQLLPFGRPVLPMICKKCAYMRIHDYAPIKEWIESNPMPDAEGSEGGE
ncbi:hypothetical protein [Stenotrophomonas koreensis]|uniref:hypothetical protein n=1 Tax=Stenotrophomonas koreensis TaxID=266128 RepID=UPI00128F098E|nr:hypothetical protein [Stenotrophomonas koreensis]